MLKFFRITKYENFHITTLLKSIVIAFPVMVLIFAAGENVNNLPLCFAFFMVGSMFLFINLGDIIEDLKLLRDERNKR